MAWTPFMVEAPAASPRIVRRLRLVAWLAAALAVTVGVVALLGWAIHVRGFVAPMAGLPQMAPDTALMLILSGLSLGLSVSPLWRLQWVANVLAATSAFIALAALAQDVVGRDFIDGLLGRGPFARPTVGTSVAVLLADAALLLLDVGSRRVPAPSELLALAAAIVGMADHSALGLVALALGIAACRPDRGAMATLASAHVGGQAARRMLPVALSIPALGYLATWAQRVGLHGAPRAAVAEGVGGMVAGVVIALAVGRSLDRTDAERRRTEHEMREWKRFFDRATFGAVAATEDGRLGLINEAFARMHGYTVAELQGRPIADVFPPERHAELVSKFRMVEERGLARWESEHIRKDGTLFPVFIDVTAVRDDEGKVLYRAAYIQDITEQKEAEAAHARLASLVQSSDDVIIAEALDGTVLDWNHAAARVYGYSASEMVGRSISAIVPEELQEERSAVRARALSGETVVGLETERVRKDGLRIPMAMTLSPIRDPVGRVVGISTIERDISTLKRLEREREEWSAVVAHDLRQPAAAIRLSAESLSRSETSPARQRVIERIRKASDRLERMIGDLLDVSRIEARRLVVHAESVDLGPLVAEVVALLPGVQSRCRVDIDPDAEHAWVDAERFVQVLSNLLSNAFKYGDPDTPVEVCLVAVDAMVQVTVTNEGPGISPDEVPKLFSRFARTRAAQSGGVPGLGLGLYICRGIVEAHGGRLWVESVPGDKTHFRFTVPRAHGPYARSSGSRLMSRVTLPAGPGRRLARS
jgi:PAS domain S-box-containing protein